MSSEEIVYYGFKCKNLIGLEDNEEIIIRDVSIKCMLTPGHTKGSMCYLLNNQLFTGDTLFAEGCGLCESKGSCPYEMFASIQRVKNDIHLETLIYPGHAYIYFPGLTLEEVTQNNIYLMIEDVDLFVNFRMRTNNNTLPFI